ncbi:hypothetical protein SPBR_06673 [Sporothrix brasiliensis 5110]|uniref:Major facilitator superfamily transporter n=1 Tax=Sporothrix brasiliensis 5110 TaxID=1398154 RepID=A0A0C2IMM7_9PEZI|nr:uncharacterized protein SPBR_06673 [Sporothrix brasiliensis 5110]KIH88275.1 hypothetical protein SPBR_06673 [Sporothrix brasiliensis 5110]
MASPTDSTASFRTAQEGSPHLKAKEQPDPNNDKDRTPDDASKSSSPYRPVRDIPYQLRDHIRVFLEEKMCIRDGEAIQLLTSLAAAGGSDGQSLLPASTTTTTTMTKATAAQATPTPIWLPPPSHLAVLASLAVHPAYTTRPQDGTDLRVAGHAMQYLRHVLRVAGPVGAEMATAFAYRDAQGQPTSTAARAAARARAGARAAGDSRGRTGRPRRQLRASLTKGEYVDSQTMSWSDDDGGGNGGWGAGTGKKKRKSKSGSRRRGAGGGGDRDRGNDDMDMGDQRGRGSGSGGGDKNNNADAHNAEEDNYDDRDDYDAQDNDEDAVSGRMATRDGIWMRGESFWRVAAWALGCSVREPARWRTWRPWLTFMVDVIEADLAERLADDDGDDDDDDGVLYDSLLFQYLSEDGAGGGAGGHSTSHLRRIAAAILADGSQPALAREVFDKETVLTGAAATATATANTSAASASISTYTRPKRVLDLDNDKFGDYSDDEESAPSTPESSAAPSPSPSPSPSPFHRNKAKPASGKTSKRGVSSETLEASADAVGSHPGFLESLPLRRRLFYLVALGSVHFSSAFATADAVYRSFAEVLRETEISVFAAFVASPPPAPPASSVVPLTGTVPSPSPDDVFVGLLRHILFTYLPASVPKPHIVDPVASQAASAVAAVSPCVLERCFLPFAANTVLLSANVRMALALESLFRIVWQQQPSLALPQAADSYNACTRDDLWSPALQVAAETGVRARENRVRSATTSSSATSTKRKSALAVEAYGRDLLQRSGRRLLAMVQLARMDAGEPEMVTGDL